MSTLIGQPHADLLAWLQNEWPADGPPVGLITGFPGAGKTSLAREFIKQVTLPVVNVAVPDSGTDIHGDLLFDLAWKPEDAGITELSEVVGGNAWSISDRRPPTVRYARW